jgi:hypothetical protein
MLGIPFTSVWGTRMRITTGIAALAATLAAASPASAQAITGKAKGTVLQPLTMTKGADLDFGTIVSGTSAGVVRIEANEEGDRSVGGGVVAVLSDVGHSAFFTGAGPEGRVVNLTLTYDDILVFGDEEIEVAEMFLDNGAVDKEVEIGSSGAFTTYVGGQFNIAENQPAGVYTGSFKITAEYN